ncbi:MAG: DUF5522 domain-containing protein [Chitinophagaceae bacterium]|nr:DUF5522 domain-containing protein [Chitinophagaceae bacterium]
MKQLIEGYHYYFDDNGLMVFTEQYHLEKGFCCGYGCRHCPYDFENVPEPKKSLLLSGKNRDTWAHEE